MADDRPGLQVVGGAGMTGARGIADKRISANAAMQNCTGEKR